MTTDPNALAVSAGLRAALGFYRLVAEIGRGGMANVFLALFPPPTSGGTFRTATTSYDIADEESETPNFRPRIHLGLGAACVAAAAAIGVAYAAHAPIGAPASAAKAPVIVAPAPSVSPASPEPTSTSSAFACGTISAVLLARPAHARLFLDGVPLEGNPAGFRRSPDDKPHLLRIEAPGYPTLVRIVDLDRDVAKEFELAPSTGSRDERPRPAKLVTGADDPWGI
jgi:hypothetical protein